MAFSTGRWKTYFYDDDLMESFIDIMRNEEFTGAIIVSGTCSSYVREVIGVDNTNGDYILKYV